MFSTILLRLLVCVNFLTLIVPSAVELLPCRAVSDPVDCLYQNRHIQQPFDVTPRPLVAAAGGFLEARGDKLMRHDQVVVLKGVNYYPQWKPWSGMWTDWNGPQIERELRLARDQLGINSVRVLLPYNFTGAKNGSGKTPPQLVGRLSELAQIAGSLDLRLIITLFDFYPNFEQPGSEGFTRDLAYVRTVVGAFANDERIAAWDVHNEPDHYGAWGDRQAEVLNWLGLIADEIHQVAPRQLVTVGMGQHTNLWLAGPDGRRPIDYSDVVSVHIYNAGIADQQLDELRTHTNKPIVVEEFGWPTDPPCLAPNYTETTQRELYRTIIGAAATRSSGVMAWTLRDFDSTPTMRWNSREEHYGLYRPDGSLKPAAGELQAYHAPPLPSTTRTTLPLTQEPGGFPNDRFSPVAVPDTPYIVKGIFRLAWEQKGGRASFGLPLGDAFERLPDRQVLQFFENAMLELDGSARYEKGYNTLSDSEKIRRTLIIHPLHAPASGALKTQPVADIFIPLYQQIDGEWRLGAATSAIEPQHDGTQIQQFEKGRLIWDARSKTARVDTVGITAWNAFCEAAQ